MCPVEKYKLLLLWLVKTNTYFCDEFLWAVYFQIKHAKKYLKKKLEIASTSMFYWHVSQGHCDSKVHT